MDPRPVSKRILVADDDDAIQLSMEDIAEQEGWDLIYARDGEECLRVIEKESPALVILDYRMPKLTGEQVLEILESKNNRVPVVFFSAEKDLQRFKRFPSIIQILNKPFDLNHFIDVVNRFLASI